MCRVFSIDLYAFSLFECNEKTSLVSKGRSKAMQVVKQTYQPDFGEARAIKGQCPSEMARQLRGLNDVKKFKATEFRMFLLETGISTDSKGL